MAHQALEACCKTMYEVKKKFRKIEEFLTNWLSNLYGKKLFKQVCIQYLKLVIACNARPLSVGHQCPTGWNEE